MDANLLIKIPKSVDNDMLLRVKDKGNQALNENYGDLILMVKVKPSEVFTR
jgi:DnaJ-class molecular chaperone